MLLLPLLLLLLLLLLLSPHLLLPHLLLPHLHLHPHLLLLLPLTLLLLQPCVISSKLGDIRGHLWAVDESRCHRAGGVSVNAVRGSSMGIHVGRGAGEG